MTLPWPACPWASIKCLERTATPTNSPQSPNRFVEREIPSFPFAFPTMATSADNQTADAAAPWYSAYPAVKGEVKGMTRDAVLKLLKSEEAGKAFVLIDVRRADHEVGRGSVRDGRTWSDVRLQGGTIRGSINLPAQSLYPTIPTLYTLFKAAGVKRVLWYCGECRPPWCCGWWLT